MNYTGCEKQPNCKTLNYNKMLVIIKIRLNLLLFYFFYYYFIIYYFLAYVLGGHLQCLTLF